MRIIVVLAVVALALLIAWLVGRRRADAPTQPPAAYSAPAQLDRSDFAGGTSGLATDCSRFWRLPVSTTF